MNAQNIIGLGAWVACFLATSVAAAEDPAAQETMAQKALARDTVCTVCHNESWRVPVLEIYQTRMGNRADPRAPNCQGCHSIIIQVREQWCRPHRGVRLGCGAVLTTINEGGMRAPCR